MIVLKFGFRGNKRHFFHNLKKTIMISYIIQLSFWAIYLYKGVPFLITYFKLKKRGVKVKGYIESVEPTNWISMSIPKIKVNFITLDNNTISGMPVRSWFVVNNDFKAGRRCILYYDEENPSTFVIKGTPEMRINILLVVLVLACVIGLFFR